MLLLYLYPIARVHNLCAIRTVKYTESSEQLPDIITKKRWHHVQYLANQFWLKWRREYLQNIQLRRKWPKTCANLRIGDLVLLKDEQLPRCEWHVCKGKRGIYKQ